MALMKYNFQILWETNLPERVGITKQTRIPDPLICYSDTRSKHSAEQWEVIQGTKKQQSTWDLQDNGNYCSLNCCSIPYIAGSQHRADIRHSRKETGLLKELTAADRALASASPACVPPALHAGGREILWHSWAQQSNFSHRFLHINETKMAPARLKWQKSSDWNTGKPSGILEWTPPTEQDFYCLGGTPLPKT